MGAQITTPGCGAERSEEVNGVSGMSVFERQAFDGSEIELFPSRVIRLTVQTGARNRRRQRTHVYVYPELASRKHTTLRERERVTCVEPYCLAE